MKTIARLMIFITEKVSPSLRGYLTRWCLELKSGVFIGTLSRRVGQLLWEMIKENRKDGRAMWIYTADNEQKYKIETCGTYPRVVRDFEGISLVTIPIKHINMPNNLSDIDSIEEMGFNPGEIPPIDGLMNDPSAALNYSVNAGSNSTIPADDNSTNDNDISRKDRSERSLSGDSRFVKLYGERDRAIHIKGARPKNLHGSKSENSVLERIYRERRLDMTFPPAFIVRTAQFHIINYILRTSYAGLSSYIPIENKKTWYRNWQVDVENLAEFILSFIHDNKSRILPHLYDKKIISFDIETTTYEPKIYEGYVNILGIAWIDFRDFNEKEGAKLHIHQVFNVDRNRQRAPYLLALSKDIWEDADIGIVFNRKFDVFLLRKLNNELPESSRIKFPPKIIDYFDHYNSLKELELELARKSAIKRTLTQKGKYEIYYRKFKGIKTKEGKKHIEPIGIYNLTDALTPMAMFFIDILKGKFNL